MRIRALARSLWNHSVVLCLLIGGAVLSLSGPPINAQHHPSKKQQEALNRDLRAAIQSQDEDAITALVKRGADARGFADEALLTLIPEGDGARPLSVSLLKTFLEQGANVNARYSDGGTLLMEAAVEDDADTARFLIRRGADLNAKDGNGLNALMRAACAPGEGGDYCAPIAAHLLLTYGAPLNDADEDGNTALILVSGVSADDDEESGTSVVFADDLVLHGANVNARNKIGLTALMAAVYSNGMVSYGSNQDLANLLLEHGARPNVTDRNGYTALMYLCQLNDNLTGGEANDKKALELAQNLVHHGADVTLKNRYGHTALDIARKNHLKRVVKYLAAAGKTGR